MKKWINKPHDNFMCYLKMAYELDFWKVLMSGADAVRKRESGFPGDKQHLK